VTSVPGKGSVFTLSFETGPLEGVAMLNPDQVHDDPAQSAAEVRERWSIPPARVLIADDGAENRELVSLVLAEQGLWVEQAENGQMALDMTLKGGFDVVLMDMQMPVMDGLEATREIRAFELANGRPRSPIIMLSANAMDEHVKSGLAAGADFHLAKPITASQLVDAVVRAKRGAADLQPARAARSA
jgi:CheY-like chemotaxis protein